MTDYEVRTDLAIESAQMFSEKHGSLKGVSVEESEGAGSSIHVTCVRILNEEGAKALGKAVGDYITLDVPELDRADGDYHREITTELMHQLKKLVPDIAEKEVLVAGVGNREVSPDALGPMVTDHLFITRHLVEEYGKESEVTKGLGCISALSPGVMAQTGIETREILMGTIRETNPDLLIVVDALAARSVSRLNKTIQMTNTGIAPGAGIGNQRFGIDEETMGVPVIAIGIPTVIDAATIVNDTMERLLGVLSEKKPKEIASAGKENDKADNERDAGGEDKTGIHKIYNAVSPFDYQQRYQLMRELMEPEMMNMFVTPKNIDEIVVQMSYTVSEAINSLCHQGV